MDQKKRAALVEQINRLGALPDDMPVVPLAAFFDGNDDLGSIGCNLPEHPGVDRFYEILAKVKARADVQDVLVGIYEVMDEEYWPFAETVYVLTSARAAEVTGWVRELEPDEVTEGFLDHPPAGMPALKPGMAPVRIWWD